MKCDIIAGGNSLRGFDFDSLDNFRIVLNNCYKYIDYDLNVWYDRPPELNSKIETITMWGGRWLPIGRDIQRDFETVSNCNSSLILAVNIAINLGYTEVNIYGADFHAEDYLHWYDSYPTSNDILKRQNHYFRNIKNMWNNLTFLDHEKINFIRILPE